MAIEQHRELDEIEAGIDSEDLRKSQKTDNSRTRSMAICIHEPNDCGGEDDNVWNKHNRKVAEVDSEDELSFEETNISRD